MASSDEVSDYNHLNTLSLPSLSNDVGEAMVACEGQYSLKVLFITLFSISSEEVSSDEVP